MGKGKLEIACFNLNSALIAHQYFADRVELCKNIMEGGLTPDYTTASSARTKLSIDLFVMIRPRGGNFVYSNEEFEQMKKDIKHFKKKGMDGFVFGILNKDNTINIHQNSELVKLAAPKACTFHRAFDEVKNPLSALEGVIACGFKTILTSGQKPSAIEGIDLITQLITKANERIEIMPGGGVRSSNILTLKQKVNSSFYHSSGITDNTQIASISEIETLRKLLK